MARQLNDWMAAQPLERQIKILAKADPIQASICLAELRTSLPLSSPPPLWPDYPDQMQSLRRSLQPLLPNRSDQLG